MRAIQFTVATNWDPKLIDELVKYPVVDVYGCADHTLVGGGRSSMILPKITDEKIAEYVKKVHENKMKFSYLLNAPCMNNMEYDKEYHRQLIDYLQWIKDIGSDSVIITTPFLVQLVKEQFPKLEIRISTIATVNSVNRAKFYEKLGATMITPDVMINRDFKTLENIKKALKCEIVLLLTDGCLYQCPFRHYHYNILGHASQTHNQFDRHYIDYCVLSCSVVKFSDPIEVIKSRWVRPEDLSHYEAIGINHFKIAGRRMPTDWILRSVDAFSKRKYEGNLVDIIQGFSMSYAGIPTKVGDDRWGKTLMEESKAKLLIDNSKLDGFIDFFKTQNCTAMCGECKYCEEWAEKAVVLNPEEAGTYVDSLQDYVNDIITSKEFGLTPSKAVKKKKKKKLDWDPESQKIFDELIGTSPPEFQSMARMMIKGLAEGKAKKRKSTIVENQDIVPAFLEGTPGPFQEDLRKNLKKHELLPEE